MLKRCCGSVCMSKFERNYQTFNKIEEGCSFGPPTGWPIQIELP